jgi:hypothetical protein
MVVEGRLVGLGELPPYCSMFGADLTCSLVTANLSASGLIVIPPGATNLKWRPMKPFSTVEKLEASKAAVAAQQRAPTGRRWAGTAAD